jgi:hypothetical protein
MRWLTPAFLFAAAAYVAWRNATDPRELLVFPFLQRVWPELGNDPVLLGHATVALIGGVGAVSALVEVLRSLRERRRAVASPRRDG